MPRQRVLPAEFELSILAWVTFTRVMSVKVSRMAHIGNPIPGQWYLREDTAEKFLVTDCDDRFGTIEVQTSNGDLDEMDEELWQSLPLSLAEPSQDWASPIDTLTAEDREGMESEVDAGPTRTDTPEAWEDTDEIDEISPYTERHVPKDLDS